MHNRSNGTHAPASALEQAARLQESCFDYDDADDTKSPWPWICLCAGFWLLIALAVWG